MPGKKRGTPVPTQETMIDAEGKGSEPFIRYLTDFQKKFENLEEHIDQLMPIGAIQIYIGSFSNIPKGWFLCNGANNTPNLSSKFVVGTTSEGSIGNTGGHTESQLAAHNHSITHNHASVTSATENRGHTHSYEYKPVYVTEQGEKVASGGWDVINSSDNTIQTAGVSRTHTHTVDLPPFSGYSGTTQIGDQTNGNLPPYYKVAYIMRKV